MTNKEIIEYFNNIDCNNITNITNVSCEYNITCCSECIFMIAKNKAIEALKYKSFADNAIKVLNNTIANERREYEDKVRKCIERIENSIRNFVCKEDVLRIIKEEMGCENDSNYISILNRFNIRIHISFYDVEFD